MLLAIDVGNTNIKFSLHDGTAWQQTRRVRTPDFATNGAVLPIQSLFRDGLSIDEVEGVAIASVVPKTTEVMVEPSDRLLAGTLLRSMRSRQCWRSTGCGSSGT